MRVSQADYCTVRIERNGMSFLLRYNLYQDGEERHPESITCRGDTVVAYFLTTTIRDYITDTGNGFAVERSWKIVPEGAFALSFLLDLQRDFRVPWLFPGLCVADTVPQERCLAPGLRTAYPNALYLFSSPLSVLVFTDPARSERETGSIALTGVSLDEEPFCRVEIRVPAAAMDDAEKRKRSRRAIAAESWFQSAGDLEYSQRLNVVIAAPEEIHRVGIAAVLKRLKPRLHPRPELRREDTPAIMRQQIRACCDTFLVARGSLCGLRERKHSPALSSRAGCTLALLILRYCPEDRDLVELARRLADFALKGQHPGGLFYPSYDLNRQSWLGSDTAADAPPGLPIEESAAIAAVLVYLVAELRSRGLTSSRYLHAASRLADALLASGRHPGELGDLLYPDSLGSARRGGGLTAAVELFQALFAITGKDAYRKAMSALRSRWFSEPPRIVPLPGREKQDADCDPALLRARTAILLKQSGYAVKDLGRYFTALLPWLYLNHPGSDSGLNPIGGVCLSLADSRLRFRAYELAYLLLKLDSFSKGGDLLQDLEELIFQLLAFGAQKPLGTSWYAAEEPENRKTGPADSTVWVRELYYLARLSEELAEFFQAAG